MGASMIDRSGSSRRGRRRGGTKPMSEINVTPFVDVMLVLLIIFMVAAPLLQVGVPLELPETAAEKLPQEKEEPLVVSMTADGLVLIQETEVPKESLIPLLKAVISQRQDDKVFIRADGNIDYASVMQVMGALNQAGYHNIGLVTDNGGPTLDQPAE
ncbi:protein TolR [Halovulum sp. GXIMD14793]